MPENWMPILHRGNHVLSTRALQACCSPCRILVLWMIAALQNDIGPRLTNPTVDGDTILLVVSFPIKVWQTGLMVVDKSREGV